MDVGWHFAFFSPSTFQIDIMILWFELLYDVSNGGIWEVVAS